MAPFTEECGIVARERGPRTALHGEKLAISLSLLDNRQIDQ